MPDEETPAGVTADEGHEGAPPSDQHPKSYRDSTLIQLVRCYQRYGWHLVPIHAWEGDDGCSCRRPDCSAPGKHPISTLAPRGVKDATNDLDVLLRWFGIDAPWANVGLACGLVSGVNVVDVDPRHHGDAAWANWVHEAGLRIDTLTSHTGGGGTHYFYRYAEGLRNRTNLLRGVDFKTDGGYVVLPPSTHESGGTYDWA